MDQERQREHHCAKFVAEKTAPKPPRPARKCTRPTRVAEAKNHSGERQADKRGHDYAVQIALAEREAAVIARAGIAPVSLLPLATRDRYGRWASAEFHLCGDQTTERMNHRMVCKPKNPKTPSSSKFMNIAAKYSAGNDLRSRGIGVRMEADEARPGPPVALAACRHQIRGSDGGVRVRSGKNVVVIDGSSNSAPFPRSPVRRLGHGKYPDR